MPTSGNAPPAPPTHTVHRAQRPWRHTQACNVDHLPPPHRDPPTAMMPRRLHHARQQEGTTSTPRPLYTRPKGPGVTHKHATLLVQPRVPPPPSPTTQRCCGEGDWTAPRAPPHTTVRRAQRPWHRAQARGANRPTPNRTCCNHQHPPQRATTTATRGSQRHPPQQPSTRLQCPGIVHKCMTSIARDGKPTTVTMVHRKDDSHTHHAQGAPAAPYPPPH